MFSRVLLVLLEMPSGEGQDVMSQFRSEKNLLGSVGWKFDEFCFRIVCADDLSCSIDSVDNYYMNEP